MIVKTLDRTGAPDEENGEQMFKDELRESVLKNEANGLGSFEDNDFYIVATLCDPRYIHSV